MGATAPSAAASFDPPTPAASARAAESTTSPAPPPDACFTGVELGPPTESLPALVAACAPGTEDVAPPRSVELSYGVTDATFTIRETPRCVRVFVVSESPVALSATVSAPGSATVVAEESSSAPFLVVDRDGPFCVNQPGDYRISVQSEAPGRAHVWVRSPQVGH